MSSQGARALRNRAVVYIIDTFAPGAPERAGLAVMNRVAHEGIATFLVAPITPEEAAGMQLSCEEIFSIPEIAPHLTGTFTFHKRIHGFLKLCRLLYDLSLEYTDFVVHTHGATAGFWGRWAAWTVGVGHTVHTVYQFPFGPYMPAYRWWFAYIVEYMTSWVTSEYICLSAKDRALGSKLFPYFAKRCAVINAGVDWQQFYTPEPQGSAMRLPASPIVIGVILEIGATQQRSLHAFLKLVEQLYVMGVPIRGEIIGDGPWRWEVTQWLLERGLSSEIKVLGWQAQTAAVIKTWHIFVHCSLSDTPSVGVVQARLSWVPVVAYHVGAVDDMMKNEKNSLLVVPGDEAALFKAVYRVIIDRPLYERLATYQENLHDYSEAVVCLRHVKLYKNIAGE
ncbi:MAG: hypothetical protein QG604_789 [Candidatus Dependentiae bacterium]|nr:hypothetical protein [Candidatus Dependentiae bacterium]